MAMANPPGLARLKLFDFDAERGTLFVRQGKGKNDRMIPIGARHRLGAPLPRRRAAELADDEAGLADEEGS